MGCHHTSYPVISTCSCIRATLDAKQSPRDRLTCGRASFAEGQDCGHFASSRVCSSSKSCLQTVRCVLPKVESRTRNFFEMSTSCSEAFPSGHSICSSEKSESREVGDVVSSAGGMARRCPASTEASIPSRGRPSRQPLREALEAFQPGFGERRGDASSRRPKKTKRQAVQPGRSSGRLGYNQRQWPARGGSSERRSRDCNRRR